MLMNKSMNYFQKQQKQQHTDPKPLNGSVYLLFI